MEPMDRGDESATSRPAAAASPGGKIVTVSALNADVETECADHVRSIRTIYI